MTRPISDSITGGFRKKSSERSIQPVQFGQQCPHVESYGRFLSTVRAVARQSLDLAFQVAGVSLTVVDVRLSDPSVSEERARVGRDDLLRRVQVTVQPSTGPLFSLDAGVPCPTARGTILRRSNQRVTEYAPLAQLVPAPGLHFFGNPRGEARSVVVQPRFGRPISVRRTRSADGRIRVRLHLPPANALDLTRAWERLTHSGVLEALSTRPALGHPAFRPHPAFTLDTSGRAHLNAYCDRIGHSRSEPHFLTIEDLRAMGELLGDAWPGTEDRSDLANSRLRLLGDYCLDAIRAGATRVCARLLARRGSSVE